MEPLAAVALILKLRSAQMDQRLEHCDGVTENDRKAATAQKGVASQKTPWPRRLG